MKITNATLLIFVSIFSLLLNTSCKKEVNEKQNVKSIKEIVVQKTISKEKFREELLPKIQELYKKDPVKYRILNHIAKKANAEKNVKIFNMQVSDIRSEMKYIK